MFVVNFHIMELGGIWVRYKYQIVYINLTFLTDPFLIITKHIFLNVYFVIVTTFQTHFLILEMNGSVILHLCRFSGELDPPI